MATDAHAASLGFRYVGGTGGASGEFFGTKIVKVASGDWYAFNVGQQNGAILYYKSVDQGNTWKGGIQVDNSGSFIKLDVWYDRWTPGDSGNLIHIAYTDANTDDCSYRNLDVSTDTLSSETTVFNGATLSGTTDQDLSITKTKGGEVHINFDGDAGTETGHYEATTPFTSWTSKTVLTEAVSDYFFCLPGNYADTNDYDCYFLDRSADEWSRKTFDDSANSWSESVLVAGAGFVEGTTVYPQTAGCINNSTSLQFAFGWNAYDAAGSDLVGFKFDGTTSTALTDVVTNSDDAGSVSCTYDQGSSTLYVFWIGKSDGSETISSDVNIYYKTSTDNGTTWSSETVLNNDAVDDYRWIASPANVASVNVAVPVIWFNDDNVDIRTTAENYSNILGNVS